VINADGEDAGMVWLEKESVQETRAVLGILLGREEMMGKGIGRAAIQTAIGRSRDVLAIESVILHVRIANIRAVSCYKACGFVVKEKGVKIKEGSESVPFYKMELLLL
jgi:RimJ/RimL family protein N-acetyltransferase